MYYSLHVSTTTLTFIATIKSQKGRLSQWELKIIFDMIKT